MNRRIVNTNFILFLLPIVVLAFSWVSLVQADPPWEQIHKLLPADGSKGSVFGNAVALDGNISLIGSEFAIGQSTNSGAAYTFNLTTGQQILKLLPSDNGASFDNFGFSVAIEGNIALVGARWDDDNGTDSGSAYLFDVNTGKQLFKLLASDGAAGSEFGVSVALKNGMALVGAQFDEDNGINSGSVYVFDAATGQQLSKLRASDAAANDEFGFSISLSGNLALIGALSDDDAGANSGSAYVFDISTGTQLLKLHASDAVAGDLFGNSVAIDGNTAVVGSQFHDSKGGHSGAAYVFDATTGEQLFNLHASDASTGDEFGFSVGINGNMAVISSIADNAKGYRSGSAYIFDVTTGGQLFKLVASDGTTTSGFGFSVAILNNVALIGSDITDDNGKSSGSAYVYQPLDIADQLTVSPDPLIAGQDGIFSIVQALPNRATMLIYSLNGLQHTFINPFDFSIELANPRIAGGPVVSNANGDVQFVLRMPNISNSLDIWFQAVQRHNSTNFVATQIVP